MEQVTPLTPAVGRQLTTIYLGGKLGQLFGPKWVLLVASPAEALRAIDVNLKGRLYEYLSTQGKAKYYRVSVGEKTQAIAAEELTHRSGSSTVYVTPVAQGRGSGTAKLIAGIAILAIVAVVTWGIGSAAFYAAGTAATSTTAATAGGLTLLGNIAVGLSVSLILGGISQLLAPSAKTQGGQLNSNVFQGTVAGGAQGGCVPVVYGRALVAPTPISIWFGNVDYNTTANAYVGAPELTQLPGGGSQYTIPSDPFPYVGPGY